MPGFAEGCGTTRDIATMNDKSPRIMVGRFWHESNGFNPHFTQGSDFQLAEGETLIAQARSSSTTLAGIIAALQRHAVQILPSLSAIAAPGGLVDHDFFEQIKARFVADIQRLKPDAIALELHGAMGTTQLADAEGDLLAALRQAAGKHTTIAIGLDLHAHVTQQMLAAVDLCIACKENPHSDVVECGSKVAVCLLAVLRGELRPVTAMAKVPMVLPGAAETAAGPLLEIHDEARRLAKADPAIWDISLFNVFRYADDHGIGQAALVLTNNNPASAERAAAPLVAAFWHKRMRFQDELVAIGDALTMAAARPDARPLVLADMGDRVLAGAPGDSTAILAAALHAPCRLRGAIPITDPEAVAQAFAAGRDSELSLHLGGKITPGFRPLSVRARVIHLSDGNFVLAGPFQGGEPSAMGPTATLLVDGRLSLVVTSKPAFSHDPAVFTSQGVVIGAQDFVVVKSGYHFKLNFAALAKPVLVRTPGLGYYTRGSLVYRQAIFWPEHDVPPPVVTPQIFTRNAPLATPMDVPS